MGAWSDAGLPIAIVPQIQVEELIRMQERDPRLQVIDVRRPAEHRQAHVPGAVNLPLHELAAGAARLDPSRPVAAICAGGYRSSIGTSILERLRFPELFNVAGGTAAWLAAGYPSERAA
jgi:hydroxyacylglutathione hydrolase